MDYEVKQHLDDEYIAHGLCRLGKMLLFCRIREITNEYNTRLTALEQRAKAMSIVYLSSSIVEDSDASGSWDLFLHVGKDRFRPEC